MAGLNPLSNRTSIIKTRIQSELCDMMNIGDSTMTNQTPRTAEGIIKTWNVPWIGLTALGSSQAPQCGWNEVAPYLSSIYVAGSTLPGGQGTNNTIATMLAQV